MKVKVHKLIKNISGCAYEIGLQHRDWLHKLNKCIGTGIGLVTSLAIDCSTYEHYRLKNDHTAIKAHNQTFANTNALVQVVQLVSVLFVIPAFNTVSSVRTKG